LLYGTGDEKRALNRLGFDLSRWVVGDEKLGSDFMIIFDRVYV